MKWFYVTIAAVVLVGLTSTGRAQPPRRPIYHSGWAMGTLLSLSAVQKELKLTAQQKEALQEKLAAFRSGRIFQGLSREEVRKRVEEIDKQVEDVLTNVLNEKQRKRFEELQLQRAGPRFVLTDPEIAKKLNLDQDQQQKIKKTIAENRPAARIDLKNATHEERREYFAKMQERLEKINAAVLAVLMPDQKEAYEKMLGEKFTLPQPERRDQGQNQ